MGIRNNTNFGLTKNIFKELLPQRYYLWQRSLPQGITRILTTKIQRFFQTKHIIIITSNIERFQSMSLGKTTDFINTPQSDAWQSYKIIKQSLLSLIKEKNFSQNEILILISMGSAAKVLVYDLMKLNYTAWDTGQFFDLAFKEIKNLSN